MPYTRWSPNFTPLKTHQSEIDTQGKLVAAGVQKIVPSDAALREAYQRQWEVHYLQQALDTARQHMPEVPSGPQDLADHIRERIAKTDDPWDDALWGIVREHGRAAQQEEGE